MGLDSDDTTIPDTPKEVLRRKADASVVLSQLRGDEELRDGDPDFPDDEKRAEEILPPADSAVVDKTSPDGKEVPPDTDDIMRKLQNEEADQQILGQLASAKEWEKKQRAIEQERERQRGEIERQIDAETRKKSVGKWKRNTIIGAAFIIIIIAAAVFTFSVQPNLPATQDSFPYVSSYNVRIPQGEPVDFAGIPVTVSGSGDKVIVSISGGLGTEIGVGDKITLSSPKRMLIRIFGITLFDSDYQIVAKFRGYVPVTSQNDFAVAVMTTRPVPEWAVGVIMPDGVDVTPISGDDF